MQQLDPSKGGGNDDFLGGWGPPWSGHQGSASVAGQRCWWEGSGQVTRSRRSLYSALLFIFLTSSLLSFLERQDGVVLLACSGLESYTPSGSQFPTGENLRAAASAAKPLTLQLFSSTQ